MNPKQLAEFGQRLRRRREAQDLTRSALCAAARITRTTLRHLESGAQHPSPLTLTRLVNALQTTEEALTGHKPIEADDPLLQDLTDEDLEVAQAFHHAPTRVKQRALGVLQERGRKEALPLSVADWAKQIVQLEPEQRHIFAMLITAFKTGGPREADAAMAAAAAVTEHAVRKLEQQHAVAHDKNHAAGAMAPPQVEPVKRSRGKKAQRAG